MPSKPKLTQVATAVAQNAGPTLSAFDALPDSALVRQSQLVRMKGRADSQTSPLPFSASQLWRLVRANRFPKPVKLSEKVTAWKVAEVRAWMALQSAKAA